MSAASRRPRSATAWFAAALLLFCGRQSGGVVVDMDDARQVGRQRQHNRGVG